MRYVMASFLIAALLAGRANAELPVAGSAELSLPVPVAVSAAAAAEGTNAAAAPRFIAPKTDDRMDFINQDRLHGRLSAATAGTSRLTWKHAAAAEDILFDTTHLDKIMLASRRSSSSGGSDAAVHLTNGDMLPGRIVSMDAEVLEVDTGYSGRVRVNRRRMSSSRGRTIWRNGRFINGAEVVRNGVIQTVRCIRCNSIRWDVS